MREIKHPSLTFEVKFDSLDITFAREAFEALASFSNKEEEVVADGYETAFLVTDRCDASSKDGECAIRLRTFTSLEAVDPSIEVPKEEADKPHGCLVLVLQFCNLEDGWADEFTTDADLSWEDYVMVVVNMTDIDVPFVLDAQTGIELEEPDIFTALQVLRKLKSGLQEMCYEEDSEEVGIGFEMTKIKKYDDFEPGSFINGNECGECESGHTYCNHDQNKHSLN